VRDAPRNKLRTKVLRESRYNIILRALDQNDEERAKSFCAGGVCVLAGYCPSSVLSQEAAANDRSSWRLKRPGTFIIQIPKTLTACSPKLLLLAVILFLGVISQLSQGSAMASKPHSQPTHGEIERLM
jgi:hypothetical protein